MCLRLRFITGGVCGGTPKIPMSVGAAGRASTGSSLASLPVTEQGTHMEHLLPSSSPVLGPAGVFLPSGPKMHSFLSGISLGRFLGFNKPILKIKTLFLQFCLTFFCAF